MSMWKTVFVTIQEENQLLIDIIFRLLCKLSCAILQSFSIAVYVVVVGPWVMGFVLYIVPTYNCSPCLSLPSSTCCGCFFFLNKKTFPRHLPFYSLLSTTISMNMFCNSPVQYYYRFSFDQWMGWQALMCAALREYISLCV